MDLQLILEAKSPLMVGGKKLGGAYNRSLDHVSGHVLRAAVARSLLDCCSYFTPADECHGRRFWVTFRQGEACTRCQGLSWCRVFDRIIFRSLRPLGTRPFPITARQCKYDADHPAVDFLLAYIRETLGSSWSATSHCPRCNERLDNPHSPLADDQGQSYDLHYQLVTRLGTDRRTRTARPGLLYSLDMLSDWQDGQRLRLEAVVTVPELEDVTVPFHVLRAGGYVSGGMGKLELVEAREVRFGSAESEIDDRVHDFNARLPRGTGQDIYLSFTLLSDADLGLPQSGGDDRLRGEAFRQFLSEALARVTGLPVRLVDFFGAHEARRGWDTAGPAEGRVRDLTYWTLRGSVFVVALTAGKYQESLPALVELERQGLGAGTENGWGQITICDAFHLDHDAQEGEG